MKTAALILAFFCSVASAKALNPDTFLDKVAQRLTGQWPSEDDYNELEKAKREKNCDDVACLEDFFRKYIEATLKRDEFVAEALLKTYERLGFQIPGWVPGVSKSFGTYGITDLQSRDLMTIAYTFERDTPIDYLFTTQTVIESVLDPVYNYIRSYIDFAILSDRKVEFKPHKLETGEISKTIQSADYSGHPNVSGIFSTPKFLNRYWNTPVNGGRKRAAAVLRLLICDNMTPALDRETMEQREEALAQGISEAQISERTLEQIHANRHGNQQDCKVCHQRLDPVARSMRPLEKAISAFSSPGNLRYYNLMTEMKDIKAPNFHELVVAATKTQRFADCQLNWFVNWIIGKDVEIHPARFEEMLAQFEKNGRKVKTTITDLLLSPEFRGDAPKIIEDASFTRANAVLRNCTECHSSFFKTRGDELKLNLSKIAFKLDLAHDGAKRLMPPSSHWWEPSKAEVQDVKNWLKQGAPLVKGKPLLNASEVQKILEAAK